MSGGRPPGPCRRLLHFRPLRTAILDMPVLRRKNVRVRIPEQTREGTVQLPLVPNLEFGSRSRTRTLSGYPCGRSSCRTDGKGNCAPSGGPVRCETFIALATIALTFGMGGLGIIRFEGGTRSREGRGESQGGVESLGWLTGGLDLRSVRDVPGPFSARIPGCNRCSRTCEDGSCWGDGSAYAS